MRQDETIDIIDENINILQKKNGFKFGIDAILLADFARIFSRDRVCDLCTGGGIIPLLISRKNPVQIVGVELQEDYADMAARSVESNSLSEKIQILQGDLKEIDTLLKKDSFDVVTVNPPYKEVGGGLVSASRDKSLAKNEIGATLDDVIGACAYLLKPQGRLYMVHRSERLCDIVCTLRLHGLEMKQMRLVQGRIDLPPSLILLEAQKGAKSKTKVLPTLITMENGGESKEIRQIYRRK